MKLTLDTRRAKQNRTYNLVFRITSFKKFKDITTGYSVNRDEFDLSTATIKTKATQGRFRFEVTPIHTNDIFEFQ